MAYRTDTSESIKHDVERGISDRFGIVSSVAGLSDEELSLQESLAELQPPSFETVIYTETGGNSGIRRTKEGGTEHAIVRDVQIIPSMGNELAHDVKLQNETFAQAREENPELYLQAVNAQNVLSRILPLPAQLAILRCANKLDVLCHLANSPSDVREIINAAESGNPRAIKAQGLMIQAVSKALKEQTSEGGKVNG
jgi:hypothetical protein